MFVLVHPREYSQKDGSNPKNWKYFVIFNYLLLLDFEVMKKIYELNIFTVVKCFHKSL